MGINGSEVVMKSAKNFLELCMQRFPSPRSEQRHSFTVEGDKLVLTLMLGDYCHRFDLDDEDLEKPIDTLLAELVTLIDRSEKFA